ELGDAVRAVGEAEREDRHAEALERVVGVAAEAPELVGREAELAPELAQVLLDELVREAVVARRDRRVRREERAPRGRLPRLLEALAEARDALADELEAEERRVPLVHVERGRRDAELPQRAEAADPEEELLRDPVLEPARVEAGRDPVVGR